MNDDLRRPLADHPDAARYERCGLDDFQEEPLYQRLCRLVARRPALLALHDVAPPTQRRATLLLAALHERVLADGRPLGLGAWYASVGGQRLPEDPALGAALETCVAQHHAALSATLACRHTQTNEIGRCSVLWPALAQVAALSGRPRLALFDFGCSAGLNLQVDACRIRYLGADGALHERGSAADGALVLDARSHGTVPPAGPTWQLDARLGVDLQPVDLADPQALRWLRACLWPSDRARDARLQAAAALARQRPFPVERCDDGLARLTRWLDTLPPGVQPVLLHSWVLAYFDNAALARFAAQAEALVRQRGLAWLSAEDARCTQALGGITLPTGPVPGEARADPAAQTFWRLRWGRQTALLARSHPHGQWLSWQEWSVTL
ncbi:DUF2332 domain-containing protein [Ideonella sp. 4Y11]|uniref:DUF2332 domain-containing protein n=1 Tax=Ideonella aquatica TaxID=2824119 RepID=A0A940YN81_9BURK|nr:DUF2332 domain-containing protein [Ideonella aquatica]MBQ0959992.1 DUF2332 domain-containing protein [Ideonella aquatica]